MATFTTVGEQQYVDALLAAFTFYLGWGTGTTTDAKGDTALQTASAEARVVGAETDNGDNFDLVGTIVSASTQAITEVGVFDASTAGNLLVRDVFAAINVNNGDGIEFTINQELS